MNLHAKKRLGMVLATMVVTCAFGAEWIAGSYSPPPETDEAAFFKEAPNDLVRVVFAAKDVPIRRAIWRVAAPGMRDLFVDGTRVTPTALPPLTPYRKRILEESFDVTALVRKGAPNELRIEIGNGWWNLLPLKMWYRYGMRKRRAQGKRCERVT